jgi:glycerophosphoryl diester phosphodiesterase
MLKGNIVAHRGFWISDDEKNSLVAIKRALDNGYGIETDLRDLNGRLVVSHDAPEIPSALDISDFVDLYSQYSNPTGLLALNIKSDGLAVLLGNLLKSHQKLGDNSVLFDMSIPEIITIRNSGLPFLVRQSEYETIVSFAEYADGYWVDNFGANHNQVNIAKDLLRSHKKIVFVSPELHKRKHQDIWSEIRLKGLHLSSNFYICTDFPSEAFIFFEDK